MALFRWSHRRVRHHTSTRAPHLCPGLILEDHCRSLWEVEVVLDVGLITCERMVYRHGATLLIRRRRSGCFPRRCWHWRRSAGQSAGRVWKRRGKRRRETREGQTRRDNERTIKRSSWMTWRWNDARKQTLEPCNVICTVWLCAKCMRKMTCEVYLSTEKISFGFCGSEHAHYASVFVSPLLKPHLPNPSSFFQRNVRANAPPDPLDKLWRAVTKQECLALALMVFGLLSSSMDLFWGAFRGDHLRTRRVFWPSDGPIRFPQHLFRRLRSDQQSLRRPDCTSSRLRAEEYDRRVTQSTATPEPGCPDPHPRSSAGRLLDPWVCHHTREPTVLSRVSCRPSHLNFDRFHQPCLLPGRTSRVDEECHPRIMWR